MAGNPHVPVRNPHEKNIPASISNIYSLTLISLPTPDLKFWTQLLLILAMITNLTDSQLSIRTSTQSQKAWHLLSLLLTIGRPARPPELAARCTSFPASPQLVQLLCSIPHSPLFLTTDLFVTPSLVALQFALTSNSVHTFMPKRFSNGDVRKYFWKRKEFTVHFDLVPFSKRRLFLSSVKGKMSDYFYFYF